MTDFDDPRELDSIAPLQPQYLEAIINDWHYRQSLDSTSVAMLLRERVRSSRVIGELQSALAPFSHAWNPERPARSWGGVTPDDYRRACEVFGRYAR